MCRDCVCLRPDSHLCPTLGSKASTQTEHHTLFSKCFSTFLMLQNIDTVPHVVMTSPVGKLFFCSHFITITVLLSRIRIEIYAMQDIGYTMSRGRDPRVENLCLRGQLTKKVSTLKRRELSRHVKGSSGVGELPGRRGWTLWSFHWPYVRTSPGY